jgi:hypothetical protein
VPRTTTERQGGRRPGLQSAVTSEPGCRVHGRGTGGGEAWETKKGLEYREPELEEPAGLGPIVDRRSDTYGRLEAGEGCGYAPCVADRGGSVGEKELGRATAGGTGSPDTKVCFGQYRYV